MADRNFSVLPHDPFLDMTFPRPFRESLLTEIFPVSTFLISHFLDYIFLELFLQFYIVMPSALVGGCGWPGDRAKDSNKKCDLVRSENIANTNF